MTHGNKLRCLALWFVLVLQGTGIRGQAGLPLSDSPIPSLSHSPIPSLPSTQLGDAYGRLPLSFEENRGQVDKNVKFLSRGNGYTLFLTATEAVLALSEGRHAGRGRRKPPRTRSTILRMKLVGANPAAHVAGVEELPGKSNYFIGSDPAKWRTNVATYARVKYREVYPGIDLVYYGNQKQLEYDWVVSPGANPGAIKFAVEGARRIKVDSKGDLVFAVAGGEVRLHKPVAYQETDGVRREIAGGYVPKSNREIGFRIAEYDSARPLVIDPVLLYSRSFGGSGGEVGSSIAVDSLGNAYVTGWTTSTNFPTVNPFQPSHAGGGPPPIRSTPIDAFVTKFNVSGNTLIYSTYLGGFGDDLPAGIAVDSLGNAYVAGSTVSSNFPTANPLQPYHAGGTDFLYGFR